MFWTDDQRAAIVKAFCDDGRTAVQIAADYGVSRNAIIGVVNRDYRRRGIKPTKAAAMQATRRARPRPNPFTGAVARSDKHATLRAAPPAPPASRFVAMADLAPGECRFAVTPHDAAPADHRFCGGPAAGGPYCDHHARLTRAIA